MPAFYKCEQNVIVSVGCFIILTESVWVLDGKEQKLPLANLSRRDMSWMSLSELNESTGSRLRAEVGTIEAGQLRT